VISLKHTFFLEIRQLKSSQNIKISQIGKMNPGLDKNSPKKEPLPLTLGELATSSVSLH
jgi:hypothetical protein